MNAITFSAEEWLRYTRHLQLPQVGAQGQQRLKRSRVVIVGAGGLGSPVALYLAAAGVGQLTLVDGDTVDLTNLQRQIIFSTDQIGHSKAEAARSRLLALNDEIDVTAVSEYLSVTNVHELFKDQDLILDCTDNFATRYLINDTCVQLKLPWVFASIFQFSGQCALFTPESACFRCLFPESPQGIADCNTAGVLGVLPGLLGTLQANEAIKFLTHLNCPLENTLLLVEALDLSFRKIQLAKNPECSVCGNKRLSPSAADYDLTCQVNDGQENEISIAEFRKKKAKDHYLLIDVRSSAERGAFHIGGIHISLERLEQSIDQFKKEQVIICYCQSGFRSQQAVTTLRRFGLCAKSLQGGIFEFLKNR